MIREQFVTVRRVREGRAIDGDAGAAIVGGECAAWVDGGVAGAILSARPAGREGKQRAGDRGLHDAETEQMLGMAACTADRCTALHLSPSTARAPHGYQIPQKSTVVCRVYRTIPQP
jgi:hypothetical protein